MANIEELDDDFILCNVCTNEYDDDLRSPKLLPCLHTLCNNCALNAANGTVLKCSICKREHPLSSDLHLVKDSTMKNMMDQIKLQRKSSSILCSDCPDNNKGGQFCKDCYVFLCGECTSAHKRTQLTRRHVVLTLEELKTSGIGSFSKKEVCSLPGHEGQPFSFYCENEECQKPVCTQCAVCDHSQANGHVIRNLGEVFEEQKVLVERLVGELLTKISEVSSEAKDLETESNTIDEKHTDMSKQVDTFFDSLEALLQKRRNQLKERIEVICQERRNQINQQLSMLQKDKSDMENTCNYSSRMLVFTNKPEFLDLKSIVVSKLNTLVNTEYELSKPEPLELSFNACTEEDRFQEIIQNIGEVETNACGNGFDSSPVVNGCLNIKDNYVLPYKGPPRHPPEKLTSNKVQTRLINDRIPPKVEPLKLEGLNNEPTRAIPSKPVLTTPSPIDENVLGRPLTLKSPVISTRKQPTSLGDFLNVLHHQTREIIRAKKYQWMLGDLFLQLHRF